METTIISNQGSLNKGSIPKLVYCAGLALFWVVFLWNFWSVGPYAFGVNAFVFLSLFFGIFIWVLRKEGRYERHDLLWIIPFMLVIAGFAIYDNPFIKIVSFPALPALFALFYNQAFLANKKTHYWNFDFIIKMFLRILSVLSQISASAKTYLALVVPAGQTNKRVVVSVIAGIVIFLAVALTVIVPLLSSADILFSGHVRVVTEWLQNIFTTPLAAKIFVFMFSSVLFYSLLIAWSRPLNYSEKEEGDKKIDSIIVGIVLGGVLCLYLLFLWIQLNRLWIGALPFDFKETEQLVKSGFWQLLALSVLNILIYFLAYRKTVPLVQKLLSVLTIASLLLLVSAGQRMGLYVTNYGFSYEKFFASYTVLYCAILFIWLIAQLFRPARANIVKFLITLFLWMFAILSVFPVEQFIFRANIALYHREGSRIILSEMKMLSPDVLALVKANKERGLLTEEGYDWNEWIENQERIVSGKMWYEKNIMNIAYALGSQKSP